MNKNFFDEVDKDFFKLVDKDFFKLVDKAIELKGELLLVKTRKSSKMCIYVKHKNKKNARK